MPDFDAATVAVFAAADEIDVETAGTGGEVHRTTIWIVTEGRDVFVRSVRGAGARWYREAVARPDMAVLAGGARVEARALAAADAESVRRASEGYRAKYASSEHMASMVREEVLPTTLRLEPR